MSDKKKQRRKKLSVKLGVLMMGLCLVFGMSAGVIYADSVNSKNLLNGSFEEGQTWEKDYYQLDQDAVPAWNTTAFEGKIELLQKNTGTYITNVTLEPSDGDYAAELNADEESTLYQNVSTTPSSVYKWGIDHGGRNGTDTMALVIGPGQDIDPSKPNKDGRDQFMQMVDWLIEQGETSIKTEAGLGEILTVYSKKFAAAGTFEDNAGNNAFSMTPSTIYTEEWHIWIMSSSRAVSGTNPWNSYGSNAEENTETTNGSESNGLDLSKDYLYTVPQGQTNTLFAFVSVGIHDSIATSGKNGKTYGNFLDNVNFDLYHPLSASTTSHGSAVIVGSDGTTGSEGVSEGHEITVDHKYSTYVTDGEPLKLQAIVKSEDAEAGCEFVGVYYTTLDKDGNSVTNFLQKAGNEIVDDGNLSADDKKGKWIQSEASSGNVIFTYYLEGITSPTNLHFVFIKNPTVTYDPNGGKKYDVQSTYNKDEDTNVYSFKPVNGTEEGADYTFIPPYVSHAAEGQNDGWKFMGWLLTGDTLDDLPEDIELIQQDQLGSMILPAEHTVACDYALDGVGGIQKAQYFKIYEKNAESLTEVTNTTDGRVTGVKWDTAESASYANVHRGLTMVAQWRWRQAFIPQIGSGAVYTDSDSGGTVKITSVTDSDDKNYVDAFNTAGGKAYFAETNETITVEAKAKEGFTFEGWYDEDGKLVTTSPDYLYVETEEGVNTFYARFSGSVTQTYIRQIQNGGTWENITDSNKAGTLDRYTYTDVPGTSISSTATAGNGYKFDGWFDTNGDKVSDEMLINNGATICYTTTENATYYARFSVIEYKVNYDLNGASGTISDDKTYYHSNIDSTKSTISVTDTVPSKNNYVFDGWELVGSSNMVSGSLSVDTYWNNADVVGDLTDGTGEFNLKALWKEQEVTIRYVAVASELSGCTVDTESESVKIVSGEVGGSTAVPKEGYYFAGWYDTQDCEGTPVCTDLHFTPEKMTATYYAKFDLEKTVVITVTGNNDTKEYNGSEQSVSGYEVSYTIDGVAVPCPEGIVLNPNDSEALNKIAKGTDVTEDGYRMPLSVSDFAVEDQSAEYTYQLIVNPGKLVITPKAVTIIVSGNTDTKNYNGSEQTVEGFTFEGNPTGVSVTLKSGKSAVAKGTDVRDTEYMMGLTEDFFEATGEKSGNYSVTWEVNDGWLRITKADRPANTQISAIDYNAPYDANAHGITVCGAVLPGDIIYYSSNGDDWSTKAPSRTDVQSKETVCVKVENPNYKIDETNAFITIFPRLITITADSAEKTYDGDALTKNRFTTTVFTDEAPDEGLISGQIVTAVVSGSQTKIGSSDNTVGSAVIKDGETDVTDNYYIIYEKGVLSVIGTEDITVTKVPAQTSVATGETITWKVTVKNNGENNIYGLNLTDSMNGVVVTAPDGVDLTDFSLSAGGKVEVTVTYKNAATGIYTNHVEVSQPKYDPDNNNAAEKIAECDSESVTVSKPLDTPVGPDDPALNSKDHVAYIIGYPDLTVRPCKNITRGEVATIFFRLLTDESRKAYWSQQNSYSDVNAFSWYNNAISTLSNAGIISGYPDGTFRPDAPISRAEFATIAARFSKTVYNGGNSFSDVDESHWAFCYISLAEYLGWIIGYPDGTFRPDQTISRAEAMTLVNRVLEREVETENMLPDMQTWPDNQPGAWYYEAVQEATNSHEYVRTDKPVPDQDFSYEDWQKILEVPDWASLEKTWTVLNSRQPN